MLLQHTLKCFSVSIPFLTAIVTCSIFENEIVTTLKHSHNLEILTYGLTPIQTIYDVLYFTGRSVAASLLFSVCQLITMTVGLRLCGYTPPIILDKVSKSRLSETTLNYINLRSTAHMWTIISGLVFFCITLPWSPFYNFYGATIVTCCFAISFTIICIGRKFIGSLIANSDKNKFTTRYLSENTKNIIINNQHFLVRKKNDIEPHMLDRLAKIESDRFNA